MFIGFVLVSVLVCPVMCACLCPIIVSCQVYIVCAKYVFHGGPVSVVLVSVSPWYLSCL